MSQARRGARSILGRPLTSPRPHGQRPRPAHTAARFDPGPCIVALRLEVALVIVRRTPPQVRRPRDDSVLA